MERFAITLEDNFQTLVYNLNPRVKLIWFISCTGIYFTNNLIVIFTITFTSLLMFIFSKSHKTIYFKALYYLIPFFIIIFFLALWESSRPANIILAITSISKFTALFLSSVAFFVMTKPFELLTALRSFKIIPKKFIFALGISFRFIPIIFEITEKILIAQKARGLNVGKGIIRRFLSLPIVIKALVIPLMVEIFNQIWLMWIALMIRGYNFNKGSSAVLKWSMADKLVIIYSLTIILIIFLIT